MSFFGRLRQNSISSNGVTKYLAYAAGEIVLVVIGILLAVEINNWNEARANRESEQIMLKGLINEMVDNRVQLLKAMSYHRRSGTALKTLVEIFHGDYRNHHDAELDSLVAEVQWAWTFDPRLGVLNSIKTTGKINIIRNPKIQSFITSFEEEANDSREESLTMKSLILTQFMPITNQYISANDRDRYLGIDVSRSKFLPDHAGFFNDRACESLIGYMYFWRMDELNEEEELLATLDESIAIVKSEITE
jgi:Family of unknown function (DUF6090)